MASLNLRITDDMKQQLDALAEATGRNKSFLAVEALRDYLQREAWQVAEIRQAVKEADAEDFADETEVQAVRDKWLNAAG
jgi:RHH-type rel operon transcriptional repressor/antitoxin RelB